MSTTICALSLGGDDSKKVKTRIKRSVFYKTAYINIKKITALLTFFALSSPPSLLLQICIQFHLK